MRGQSLRDADRHISDGSASVDHNKAPRLATGKSEVAIAHPGMKLGVFVVDAGFLLAETFVSAAGAGKAGVEIDIDEDGGVGFEAAAGNAVEREHDFGIEAAAVPLVCQRGIGEAVAENDLPGV